MATSTSVVTWLGEVVEKSSKWGTEHLDDFLPGSCNGAGCGYPGAPAHSSVRFTGPDTEDVIDEEDALLKDTIFPEGTVATYSCERGFELLGPARRQCQIDGSWTPEGVPFCVLNVAGGKAPMQSSSSEGGIPQRAVDGSSGQIYTPQTCTLTRPEHRPWWYVNLLEPYMVQLVRLDFGKPCCGDGMPGTIVVRVGNNRPDLGTNPICNRFTGPLEEGQPLFLPCNPPMPGAFVSVHLEANTPAPIPVQLSLCEAFVYTDQALPIERCPQFRDQPPGSTATYNGKCYIFYNRQPLIFREALAFCRARGGTLVDESNPALQGFISWELWRRHRSDTSSQYWMGAVRDQKDRTVWRWTGSGEEVSVSFWSLPQGTEEDCARYDGSRGWLWSDTPCTARLNFICQHQPRACGRPEQPPNSTMTVTTITDRNSGSAYEVGATVEYTCNAGSLLIGPSTRTCLDTGFYNEFPPVCKSIECGYPANIKHGGYTLINNTVSYLSQVLYSCDEGYEMTGRARLTCDIDERWNGPPPRCEPILCDPPTPVPHSYIQIDEIDETETVPLKTNFSRSLLVGSIVTYTCDKGYRLSGFRQILCLPTGLYDHVAPTCTEEPRTTVTAPPRSTVRSTTSRTRHTFLPPRVRTTTISTTTTTNTPVPPRKVSSTAELPATVRETIARKPNIGLQRPASPSSPPLNDDSNDHPQDNEISGSGVDNAQVGIGTGVPEPSGPYRVDNADQSSSNTHQAKLNLGAVIALGVFGGFVFLAAVITTVVILIRSSLIMLIVQIFMQFHIITINPIDIYLSISIPSNFFISLRSSIYHFTHENSNQYYTSIIRKVTKKRQLFPMYTYVFLSSTQPPPTSTSTITTYHYNRHAPPSRVITSQGKRATNRGRSSKHYRHRASPDCNTVASFGSSSSESRGGLNRYYRQAWENLHETTGHKTNHPPLRRKETLDEPGYRENYRGNNTERDGSELVVSDVATYPSNKHASISDKKRHHHHHHHHHGNSTPEWRQSQSHHRY
ncbi:Sushi, von Willebrand factor type A, EGF and pentraxin domain-containing protein 1 [Melipona quadrifasciata]|uniref:Sushi, von Willebrand factor type A, EGF and pentraxin domain-containing protein 1 n=1 Tax=Melipona quadrifasciata TaxID=166423 RepID=A0A0M8ZQ81_9HYME|nr:Sushi, von Willebrand factor type A, EGF and pentraxin domain-containing protein 1 [Melipona quadrifasciata]